MPNTKGVALGTLFEEAVALYHQLTSDAALIHGLGSMSGPRRTVLVALARSGPQTVAHLARARAQSRQRFQPLVNGLLADGFVETQTQSDAHPIAPHRADSERRESRQADRVHRSGVAGARESDQFAAEPESGGDRRARGAAGAERPGATDGPRWASRLSHNPSA